MKHIHKVLSCSCALLLSLQTPALSDFAHTPGKSSVIVLQGEVTVDGQSRPDLGRSFADTITGGLLKTKAYSVIDHLSSQPLAETTGQIPTVAPEQSAIALGKASGARWIYVPRMVVEGDFQKLTLKKIRVSDGQVVDLFETHGTGEKSNMFVLIGDSLRHIYQETSRPPRITKRKATTLPEPDTTDLDPNPVGGSYRDEPAPEPEQEIPPVETETKVVSNAPAAPPAETETDVEVSAEAESENTGEIGRQSPERQIIDPATQIKDYEAHYGGTISTINNEWRFCVLKVRSKQLQVGDQLSVRTGKIVPNETTLTITKLEGTQAVADLSDDFEPGSLKVGQRFYKWLPK